MQTKIIKINPDFPEEGLIRQAAGVLRRGGIVAFPTETVYGAGANFLDKKAVERLHKIKKRPDNKPFTAAIADFSALEKLDVTLTGRAENIACKFWPGPLTIVAFNKKKEKIGIRMPENKIALSLIGEASVPVALPSANISGNKPPSSAQEVSAEMSGLIDMILDGGITEIGIESTVLDITAEPFAVLRKGAIPEEDLAADYHVLFVCTGNSCRSVMAEGLMKKFIKESGLSKKVSVDSAGTNAYPGIPAAQNTIEALKEIGIDISMHKGKAVTPYLLRKSDFIFVMEETHKNTVLNKLPKIAPKVKLLKEGREIPDPIGRPIEEYRRIRDIIKDEVENIFLELFKEAR